ncbi:MAG: hypothetical protein CMG20_01850 [Candidatus Marinimicrobia bacterium]|nr:hypothetical protein [Candidatus Neomarinimicrobiota bacterium]|tara:strand:+ start:98311 stop:99252 length:942 start_codon:yes stop_codon:yes gene_type:complete
MINTYLLIALLAAVVILFFYVHREFNSRNQNENNIDDKFSDIEENSNKKFQELSMELVKAQTALETTYQASQEGVSKSLDEFRLIYKGNQSRGSFGEYTVEQLLKHMGLLENVHWKKQQTFKNVRPDYTFYYPDNRYFNLDSKCPQNHYDKMVNVEGDFEKKAEKKAFEKDVKERIKEMEKEGYINVANGGLDFVVMFIPNEGVLNFVRKELFDVYQDAIQKKVLIVGTSDLFAMLQMLKQSIDIFSVSTKINEYQRHFVDFRNEYKKWRAVIEKHGNQIETLNKSYKEIDITRHKKLSKSIDLLLPSGDKEE